MRTLADIFPDIATMSEVDQEEIGAALMDLWDEVREPAGGPRAIVEFTSPLFQPPQPIFPNEKRDHVEVLVAEGWNWLWRQGLIMQDPRQPAPWFIRTREGRKLNGAKGIAAYRQAGVLPRDLLHPKIEEKARRLFLRGDYDVAVFQAFKSVEVAVRDAADMPNEKLGPALMRAAFHPERGPLHDPDAVMAEREALANLFAGAIGHAKNPHSHRDKAVGITEAARLLIFASYLLTEVEIRKLLS